MGPKQGDLRSGEPLRPHPDLRAGFIHMAPANACAKGTVLFQQGEESKGVFLLVEGKARLSLIVQHRRRVPFRVVGPGYLLGLPSAILGTPFIYSAELLEDSKIVFVERDRLLHFLRSHTDLCFDVVRLLGMELREMPGTAIRHAARRKRGKIG